MNDSYWLDAALLYPPYLIALAAIFLACAFLELDVTEWYTKLNVNRAEVGPSLARERACRLSRRDAVLRKGLVVGAAACSQSLRVSVSTHAHRPRPPLR